MSDEILNKNKDGSTEKDAAQESMKSLKAKNCKEFFKPPMTGCCCGIFTLRGGTGIFALLDIFSGFTFTSYWISKFIYGQMSFMFFLGSLPYVILFIGACFGMAGAISKNSKFVGFYVVGLQVFMAFLLIVLFLFLFTFPSSFFWALINWLLQFALMWWKCAVANAFAEQIGGGHHSLLGNSDV